jgi:hypothetical protein
MRLWRRLAAQLKHTANISRLSVPRGECAALFFHLSILNDYSGENAKCREASGRSKTRRTCGLFGQTKRRWGDVSGIKCSLSAYHIQPIGT